VLGKFRCALTAFNKSAIDLILFFSFPQAVNETFRGATLLLSLDEYVDPATP
jgi:hypothetical protein